MLADVVEATYRCFAGYRCPPSVWVCPQCGPQFSARDVCSTPLREVSMDQLVAVHVMSLDDDTLRYFTPRLLEILMSTPGPVFDFRVRDIGDRLTAWAPHEAAAITEFAGTIWAEVTRTHPASLGYFSDSLAAADLLDWCGVDLPLDDLLDQSPSAALHLADLVDEVLSTFDPFDSDALRTVRPWVAQPAVGERLAQAFFETDDAEAARRLSAAHELWTVCGA